VNILANPFHHNSVNSRFNSMDARFNSLELRFTLIGKVVEIDNGVTRIEAKLYLC